METKPVRGQTRASYIFPAWDQNLSQSPRVGSNLRQGLRKVQGRRGAGEARTGSPFRVRVSRVSMVGFCFALSLKNFH